MLFSEGRFNSRFLFATFGVVIIISCSYSKHASIERPLPKTKIGYNANEIRLGTSEFYLIVPDDIEVTEGRGKEGQLAYNLFSKDSSSKMFGYIEIEHGYPINQIKHCENPKEYTYSIFLKSKVKWTICETQMGYSYIETIGYNGISAGAFSNNKNELDSLISIIGTLSEK
jgi:hypothetical protein